LRKASHNPIFLGHQFEKLGFEIEAIRRRKKGMICNLLREERED
jgi:hypothetical protein